MERLVLLFCLDSCIAAAGHAAAAAAIDEILGG
jgi:hypothetical protein